MKKIYLFIFIILSLLFYGCNNTKGILWYEDIAKAIKIAEKSKKVLMVDIWTDWCSWCKKLDQETYVDKDIIQESKKFVCLKINPEKDQKSYDFIQPYNISGYPTILFIEADGSLLYSINGFLDAPKFFEKMKDVYNIKENIAKYTEEYSNGNYENSIKLAKILLKAQREEKALEIFFKLESNGLFNIEDKETADLYILVGTTYGGNGDYKKAKEIFEKLLNHKDFDIKYTSIYYYAVSCLLNGDEKLAKDILNKNIKDKNTPENWKTLYSDLLDKYNSSKVNK